MTLLTLAANATRTFKEIDDMETAPRANETNTRTGISKIRQYNWLGLKDKPGELVWLNKVTLRVDHSYQRALSLRRTLGIASAWSWLRCGVIIVAKRHGDQVLYVVDGQHRVLAALKRDDIKELPCIVFETEDAKEEAGGFYDVNTGRRMPTSLEKWNAQLLRGDPNTLLADRLITSSGRVVAVSTGPTQVRCLTAILRAVEESREELLRVWPLIVEVCRGQAMHERIFEGLLWLERKLPEGESLTERRWRERVLRLGAEGLLGAANRAATFYAKGGLQGMGCRHVGGDEQRVSHPHEVTR